MMYSMVIGSTRTYDKNNILDYIQLAKYVVTNLDQKQIDKQLDEFTTVFATLHLPGDPRLYIANGECLPWYTGPSDFYTDTSLMHAYKTKGYWYAALNIKNIQSWLDNLEAEEIFEVLL